MHLATLILCDQESGVNGVRVVGATGLGSWVMCGTWGPAERLPRGQSVRGACCRQRPDLLAHRFQAALQGDEG